MKTETLDTGTAERRDFAIAVAVKYLREGAAIGLPTETVYGLAADAMKTEAVSKIFEAKDRPRFDPLIVHLPDAAWLERVATPSAASTELTGKLTERFWPGPLTLVLPRKPTVLDLVTAGLETVAVRVSAHPMFSQIIQTFDGPLAAPSANRFGRMSPTSAGHVHAELAGRIPVIVDSGPTVHGLESTIVALRNERIEILRHGPVTAEVLSEFGEVVNAKRGVVIESPGQMSSHYAPRTPLVLRSDARSFQPEVAQKTGLLSFRGMNSERFAVTRTLSKSGDLREAAAKFFRLLRELDQEGLDLIVAEELPEEGLGCALMERLRRAANL